MPGYPGVPGPKGEPGFGPQGTYLKSNPKGY